MRVWQGPWEDEGGNGKWGEEWRERWELGDDLGGADRHSFLRG